MSASSSPFGVEDTSDEESIELTYTLKSEDLLTDGIIDAYLKLIKEKSKNETLILNTYITESNFNAVLDMTKKTKKDTDYTQFACVYNKDIHWIPCFGTLDTPNKVANLKYADSNSKSLSKIVCEANDYIKTMLKVANYTKFQTQFVESVQQNDGYNCGVYALVFIRNKALPNNKIEIPFDQNLNERTALMIHIRKHMIKELNEGDIQQYSFVHPIPVDDLTNTSATLSLFNPTATNLSTTTTMVYHIL